MFRPIFKHLVWRRDPSSVAIPYFDRIARELLAGGISADALFAGTGLDARVLDGREPVSFEALLRVLANARRLGGERALVELGARLVTGGTGRLPRILAHAFGSADAYWCMASAARIGARLLSPAVELRAWEVAPRRFTFELGSAPGGPSEDLNHVFRGMLATVPELFGFERVPVVVEAARESTLFHVELGEPVSWFTSLRWMPRRVRTMRVAVEELKAAHALLESQYEELRRTQITLRESEARFRALIENSSDFILLADSTGLVTYVSPSAERITGRPASEPTGALHGDLVHEEDREIAQSAFERVLREPDRTVTMRVRFRAGPAAWIWVEGTARNMLADASVRAILVNYRDITDRMRLEEQLLQARKLESIGRLAGGLAHDFNNLLMGVLGNAELSLLRSEAGAPVREQLEQIMEYSRRGAELTSQLLSFARKKVVQPRLVNVNELVQNTQSLLERLIGTHVEIVTKLTPELDAVEIDPSQLQQVLVNLATNARDAMPGGGTLTIATGHVALPAQGRAWGALREYVALVVSDTGTGMDEETRGKIFEPFFTTKEVGRGTGLGLSTCHGIVSQAGGHIDVTSKPGQGTTFRVHLPRVRQPASRVSAPPEQRVPRRGSETVLLVDDNPAALQATADLLRHLGHTVLLAASGPEALVVAERHPGELHAVISDIVMPKMSGPELVERLRVLRPNLRVLYVSAHGALREPFTSKAGTLFLQKPFDTAALSAALGELFREGEGVRRAFASKASCG